MKVCIWSKKGGSGKTPLSYYLAKEHGFKVATNDFGVYDMILQKDEFDYTPYEKAFPVYSDDKRIVFDLGGMLASGAKSIVSAIKSSDIVVVPVFFESAAVTGAVLSIREIVKLNRNIVVVATKLERNAADKDRMLADYSNSFEFRSIKKTIDRLSEGLGVDLPIYPTAKTTMYHQMIKNRKSASELMKDNPLLARSYKNARYQIEQVCKHIVKNAS
jgi:cellulose biosynthesis protein BcsQ